MKLTADQGLVVDWIAGSSKVRHTPERGFIFRALSVARRGYTAILRQQKLLTVDAFRVQVRFGKYIFVAFFARGLLLPQLIQKQLIKVRRVKQESLVVNYDLFLFSLRPALISSIQTLLKATTSTL